MEFPDDVLNLIRGFSMPRMHCVNEFCQAKKMISTLVPIDDMLGVIKENMFTDKAEDVADAFMGYACAVAATRRAQDRLYGMPFEQRAEWQGYARSVAMNIERREKYHLLLRMLLYGKTKVIHEDHWLVYNSDEEEEYD